MPSSLDHRRSPALVRTEGACSSGPREGNRELAFPPLGDLWTPVRIDSPGDHNDGRHCGTGLFQCVCGRLRPCASREHVVQQQHAAARDSCCRLEGMAVGLAVRGLAGPPAQQLFERPETASVMIRQRPHEGVRRLAIGGGHNAHGVPGPECVSERCAVLDEEPFDERGHIPAQSSARRCVVAVLVAPQPVSHCRRLRVQRHRHDRAQGPETLLADGAAVAKTFWLIPMSPANRTHIGASHRHGDAVGRQRIAERGERLVHLSAGRPVPGSPILSTPDGRCRQRRRGCAPRASCPTRAPTAAPAG